MAKKVVWTNGCFDLLHPGHLHTLKESKLLGDFLVVGLNLDRAVRYLKGPGRPIQKYSQRKTNLLSTGLVDKVVPIGLSPLNAIAKIRPDIITKGDDYQKGEVIGHELAQVRIIKRISKHSTTGLIRSRKT